MARRRRSNSVLGNKQLIDWLKNFFEYNTAIPYMRLRTIISANFGIDITLGQLKKLISKENLPLKITKHESLKYCLVERTLEEIKKEAVKN